MSAARYVIRNAPRISRFRWKGSGNGAGLRHDAGVLLPHDDVGAGPTVVLLHAGVADRRMWAAVVAPDRVAAMALVSAPAPGVEPSAELEAAWEAEGSALERGDLQAAVAAVIDAWTLPDAPLRFRERVAEMQRRAFELQARADDAMPDDDPLEPDSSALSTLNIPALVAVGELDMRDFQRGAEVLAQELRQARLVVIPDAGHLAPVEQPDAFRGLVLDFLRQS